MQPLLIDKKSSLRDSIEIKVVDMPYLDAPFHFHNAYEMVFILKSNGRRIVGDNIENFTDGDLVLMGPDLPHVWYNEKEYYLENSTSRVRAIVIYFHPDWLTDDILKSSDHTKLGLLFKNSNRGIKILGLTKAKVLKHIIKLTSSQGLKRIILMLIILDLLSKSEEYECLASAGYINSYKEKDVKRIDNVYQYVMNNYRKKIKLEHVANIAHMTPTAFCKYFKARTQKTFTYFVNEVRVGYACKLLFNENLSISEICYECGFNNFTHFNRNFQELKKMTPTEFRNNLNMAI
ncbi:MAG: hypothetical protein JWP78_1367 [Mucilaginibacter sp.]|nr:hypothetical protein [Mucilaginibacter sp.]